MSQDQDREALDAMRSLWQSNTQSADDLEQFCPTAKVCKNVAELGIQGMDDEQMASTLRSEWKAQLQRDGKIPEDAVSIADLVNASNESQR